MAPDMFKAIEIFFTSGINHLAIVPLSKKGDSRPAFLVETALGETWVNLASLKS